MGKIVDIRTRKEIDTKPERIYPERDLGVPRAKLGQPEVIFSTENIDEEIKKAELLFARGQYQAAKEIFDKVRRYGGEEYKIVGLYGLASCEQGLGNYESAISIFRELLQDYGKTGNANIPLAVKALDNLYMDTAQDPGELANFIRGTLSAAHKQSPPVRDFLSKFGLKQVVKNDK